MRRKKTIVVIVMCIAILFMAIGYALISTRLSITSSTAITSSWKVEFTDIRTTTQKGGAHNNSNPVITSTNASFQVNLVQPGDEITYEIDITNFGSIIAEVKGATYSIEGSEAIYIEIEGIRKGTVIGSCEGLSTCPKSTMIVKIGYDPLIEKDPIIKNKTIDVTLEIGQYVPNNPTEDGELVPENINKKGTLAQHILNDNNVQSDENIDFSKANSYVTYTEVHASTPTNISMGLSDEYYYAQSYTYEEATGLYTLSGLTFTERWRKMDSDYTTYPYTCKSTLSTDTCTTLYKITGYVDDTTATGYAYTSTQKDNGNGLFYTNQNTIDNKTTYYFRGNVKNNYVSFATDENGQEMLWRIVRINEDGSIRLIKQDSIASGTFNSNVSDNAGVGYMYGTSFSATYELTHENKTNSTIKNTLDAWYIQRLSNYSHLFATNAGFCSDRGVYSGTGYGDTETYYQAYNRVYLTYSPQFKCPNESHDLFTLTTSTTGNKKLVNPIGLLTADEVIYAGGSTQTHDNTYYLLHNTTWWTMTPNGTRDEESRMYVVLASGSLSAGRVYNNYAIRPVINLKNDVLWAQGNGTSINPYKLLY